MNNCSRPDKSIIAVQELLSGKYTILILDELSDGAKNYNAILNALDITSPTLTRQLKELTKQCLIKRSVSSSSPVRVEYSLTSLGMEFKDSLSSLKTWGNLYLSCVKQPEEELYHSNSLP